MPFRASATRYRQGTRNGRTRRRRRSSIGARVRYQRPSARNQKRQIQTLARMAMRNQRILNSHRIYQDWTVNSGLTFTDNGTWQSKPFFDPISWEACLRRDLTPLTQSGCFVREMQFSYFMTNNTKSLPSTISLFLVTLRRQANWGGSFSLNEEYVVQGQGSAPILNSGIFKVLWSRNHQIFPPKTAAQSGGTVTEISTGNPETQYKRGKTTLRLNFSLRSPSDLSWKELGQEDVPYWQKVYLLAYFQNEDTTANDARMTYGLKYTTITQD